MPVKRDMFAKVIQFLHNLGIVNKCEKEGQNDLSDKILQTLRVHFRNLIPFQPSQQSQIGSAANPSLAPVTGDTDIYRPGRSILSHERVDNTPSSKILDLRTLPRLAANSLIKTKQPDAVQVRYFGDRIQDMLFDFCKQMLLLWAGLTSSRPESSLQWSDSSQIQYILQRLPTDSTQQQSHNQSTPRSFCFLLQRILS